MLDSVRGVFIRYLFSIIVIFAFLLSACSDNERVKEIKDKDLAGSLFIQKAVNNSSSEEMTKMVNDKQKIKQILTKIEGLKVEKTTSEKTFEQMKAQDSYTFVFSEGRELKVGNEAPYAFYVLDDGTFIFPYSDFNSPQKPLITIKKHKELLDEIKKLIEVEF